MVTRGTIHQLKDEMKRAGYKIRTVSISRLPEIQDAVGKLVRQGLIAKSLCENWHFYSGGK